MGTLKYKKGDLLNPENPEYVIAHGCNCSNGFGSGVAGAIAKMYPEVKRAYHQKFENPGWNLGDVQFVEVDGKLIANMGTQQKYGYDGQQYVSYEAIRTCLETVLAFCEKNGFDLAIPKIGSLRGGGDWGIIQGIIVDCLKDRNVTVTIYSID
jgi:O-acetyl-ADP-ribose deacetylase (regulator of RNase III)